MFFNTLFESTKQFPLFKLEIPLNNISEFSSCFTEYNASPLWLMLLREIKSLYVVRQKQNNRLHGLSPRANYTERATTACWQS
jgi:hypothetical protein